MRLPAFILTGLIAALHGYIAWFESFAWETRGPKVFTSFPDSLFSQTVEMAANQGIYNAFLAAGLVWAPFIKDRAWQRNVAICFLLFVAIATVFGAVTVTMQTLYIQTMPAVLGMVFWYLGSKKPAVQHALSKLLFANGLKTRSPNRPLDYLNTLQLKHQSGR